MPKSETLAQLGGLTGLEPETSALPERGSVPAEPSAAGQPVLSFVCGALCARRQQSFGDRFGDIGSQWTT